MPNTLLQSRQKLKEVYMAVCSKCKTVLVKCSDCNGSGKKNISGDKCITCNGTGKLCHIHGSKHGN